MKPRVNYLKRDKNERVVPVSDKPHDKVWRSYYTKAYCGVNGLKIMATLLGNLI